MYGYVFQNISDRSRGNTLRIVFFFLDESYTDTHSQESCGKDSSKKKKHWWNLVGEKSTKLGMLIRSQKTKIVLISLCGWHQNGRKEAEFSSNVEDIDERRWHWRTNIISWPCIHGMHPTGMQTKRENYWTTQQDVWIPYFCWSNREITRKGQTSRKNFSVVLRHGRICSKMRGTVLRIGRGKDGATIQSFILVWTIIRSKNKDWKIKVNCQKFAPILFLKCLYLARIGRPDTLWSVNKLARSVTNWTQTCDRRLARLISYIHFTSDYRQHCHVGNAAQHCRLGLFQDSDFAGDLEDSKSTPAGVLCIFGSRTLVHISWKCKKQTSVSHSSTESEIISLDAGLRMDGLPALDLWDLVIEVLGTTQRIPKTNPSMHTGSRC